MINLSGFAAISRALRNPNYGIYSAGSAISLVGTWMQRVAVGWLTWQLTQSGAWLGAIAFADLFPSVMIGLVAGAAADRWDRLRVTKISQILSLIQSLLLFGLTVRGHTTIEILFALTLCLGTIAAFNQPARLALIPNLVPREDLPAAVAINSIIFNVARFIGPAVAGLLIVTVGIAAAFAANAISFALFLIALSCIRPSEELTMRRHERGLLAELVDGLRYAANHPGIAPLFVLLIVVCLCARPFVELLPGFAAEVFDVGAAGLALLTSTVGLGAVVGGLWLAQRGGALRLTNVVLGNCLALSLAIFLLVATDRLWTAVPALALAGACMVVGGVGSQTLLQMSIDGAMRGRVMSIYGLIFRGGPALGAMIMGAASDHLGLRLPLAVGAAVVIFAALWVNTRRRTMVLALEPEAGVGRR